MDWTRTRDDDGYVFYTATTSRGTYHIETRPDGDIYITKTLTDTTGSTHTPQELAARQSAVTRVE
ncbi:hypothetical protein C5C22_08965 [Rathayibacter rathayi]|nr:hypothetical protein C5C22_08965 [Rathayibacter rathayi]